MPVICRYCNKEIFHGEQSVKTLSYWGKLEFVCHAQCKQMGESQEAYECQCIDADCNDCRHYQRGKLAPLSWSIVSREDGSMYVARYQPNTFIGGTCLKFDKEVQANPNKWSGLECFEHRKYIQHHSDKIINKYKDVFKKLSD